MRQLDHPNIIKLIDFSESKQYYYIILELAPGGELFHQIVRLTYFSEDLSRHVILQVAEALEYLHEEKGVVHRLVSFSFSFWTFQTTLAPSNLSPEVVRRRRDVILIPSGQMCRCILGVLRCKPHAQCVLLSCRVRSAWLLRLRQCVLDLDCVIVLMPVLVTSSRRIFCSDRYQ